MWEWCCPVDIELDTMEVIWQVVAFYMIIATSFAMNEDRNDRLEHRGVPQTFWGRFQGKCLYLAVTKVIIA